MLIASYIFNPFQIMLDFIQTAQNNNAEKVKEKQKDICIQMIWFYLQKEG